MIARIVVDIEVPDDAESPRILDEVEQLLSLSSEFDIETAHSRVEFVDDENNLIAQAIHGVDSHSPVGEALRRRAANGGKPGKVVL